MKKTLAIAIAAAFAVPMSVMADTTLYGSAHASLDSVDVDQPGVSNNTSYSNNKSYLGVKGSEKITDGLSAVYKIEFGPAFGSGRGLSDRDQYVGLSGNYGTLVAGRASTPYKIVGAKADLFWYSQLGSNRFVTGPDARANNVIAYFTPKMGGFSAALATVTEGVTGTANDNVRANSANAFYKAGGLMVGLGLEDSSISGDSVDKRLMASYDTGKFKVVGFAERHDNLAGGALGANSGTQLGDHNVYGLGASVKTGRGAVKAQYYVDNAKDVANADSKMFAIGYDHNLSKRTTVYAQYATMNNETNARLALAGGGTGGHSAGVATTAGGQDQSGISLGIKHDF